MPTTHNLRPRASAFSPIPVGTAFVDGDEWSLKSRMPDVELSSGYPNRASLMQPLGANSWARINGVFPYSTENACIADYNALAGQIGKIYKTSSTSYLFVCVGLATTGNHLSVYLLPLNIIQTKGWMSKAEIDFANTK